MHPVSLKKLLILQLCFDLDSYLLQRALSEECDDIGLNVFIADGPDVNEASFLRVAGRGNTGSINPTLLLLGVRLGIDRVTPVYWEALKSLIRYPQSVGIAGYSTGTHT